MRDAASAGDQRAALEREARTQLINGLRLLELNGQQQLADEQLRLDERVQQERTAIYQEGLDRRMAGARDASAAELRQLERVLQAERARAQAAGDGGKVAAIDKALGSINEIQADNVREFRKELGEAERTAAELQKRLAEIDQPPWARPAAAPPRPLTTSSATRTSSCAHCASSWPRPTSPPPCARATCAVKRSSPVSGPRRPRSGAWPF
ncbi:hypothetical protein [Deinococcus multiflagellatus]|uniref:Uncharacterized protein n=1 Tax=Deinococcus multiflagellatus TaxID=1656887 RepID=A0ABW1ZU99_9DEIO